MKIYFCFILRSILFFFSPWFSDFRLHSWFVHLLLGLFAFHSVVDRRFYLKTFTTLRCAVVQIVHTLQRFSEKNSLEKRVDMDDRTHVIFLNSFVVVVVVCRAFLSFAFFDVKRFIQPIRPVAVHTCLVYEKKSRE